MIYWERERAKLKTFGNKIINGLPMAVIFGLPILLMLFVVYIFFPEWYSRISQSIGSAFVSVVVAVVLCILFFSYFRMQYKWEMNEQLYEELKNKKKKQDASAIEQNENNDKH